MMSSMAVLTAARHAPLEFFGSISSSDDRVALVLLNTSFNGLESLIKQCWNKFTVPVCADGGSNLLYDVFPEERDMYIPNFIGGDFDSARKDVLEYYERKGTSVIHLPDQDHTDFDKVITHLLKLQKQKGEQLHSVYALNAMCGRFDCTLSNVNTLYSHEKELGDTHLYLLSEDSLAFRLKPGCHEISVSSGYEEGHCGLVPLGEPCQSCTTTGLKWNLNGQSLRFGELISTNNLIEEGAETVTVETSHPLLWTMSHTLVRHFSN